MQSSGKRAWEKSWQLIPGATDHLSRLRHICTWQNSDRLMGNIMRKFAAMTIIAVPASATMVNSAFCAPPPYQYG